MGNQLPAVAPLTAALERAGLALPAVASATVKVFREPTAAAVVHLSPACVPHRPRPAAWTLDQVLARPRCPRCAGGPALLGAAAVAPSLSAARLASLLCLVDRCCTDAEDHGGSWAGLAAARDALVRGRSVLRQADVALREPALRDAVAARRDRLDAAGDALDAAVDAALGAGPRALVHVDGPAPWWGPSSPLLVAVWAGRPPVLSVPASACAALRGALEPPASWHEHPGGTADAAALAVRLHAAGLRGDALVATAVAATG